MTKRYDGSGYALLYPENWQLEEDTENMSVSLESPSGAFLTITQCDDLDSDLQKAKAVMEAEYEVAETETATLEIAGMPLDGITQRFVYLDLFVVSQLYRYEINSQRLLIQLQGEDREIETLLPVFQAILTSMHQSMIST